jgi:flagellar biosynthesis protein FlhB
MAENDSAEEKTEPPSDKKRSESRQKGSVAKSTEVNSVLVLLIGVWILNISAPWMYRQIVGYFNHTWMLMSQPMLAEATIQSLIINAILFAAKICLPVLGGVLVIGVVANVAQVGLLFTMKPLMPDLAKINPISGMGKLFSMRSFVELIKSILKLAVIGIVAYLSIRAEFDKFLTIADTTVPAIWVFLLKTSYIVIMKIILVLIIIAILDIIYQRYDHEKSLKMSHQELKEERKQMEGDPQIKSRIRTLQREMARRRMMKEVPKATVVVTNPTHIAIALQYEPEAMKAPLVLAKGKRLIAQRIRAIAEAAGVPIVEDKPLARAMYDKIEVGFEIPAEFFTAIAEILAYVYRLKNRMAA